MKVKEVSRNRFAWSRKYQELKHTLTRGDVTLVAIKPPRREAFLFWFSVPGGITHILVCFWNFTFWPFCWTRQGYTKPSFVTLFEQLSGMLIQLSPILNILVPHTGHIPWVAGLPFFMVMLLASFISLLARHFTQYACIWLPPFLVSA